MSSFAEWLAYYHHQEAIDALERLCAKGVLSRDRALRRFLMPNPYERELAEQAEDWLSQPVVK